MNHYACLKDRIFFKHLYIGPEAAARFRNYISIRKVSRVPFSMTAIIVVLQTISNCGTLKPFERGKEPLVSKSLTLQG